MIGCSREPAPPANIMPLRCFTNSSQFASRAAIIGHRDARVRDNPALEFKGTQVPFNTTNIFISDSSLGEPWKKIPEARASSDKTVYSSLTDAML